MTHIRRLDFLTPGSFDPREPARGIRQHVELFRYAETLGYDGGWVRQRHLESNLPTALLFLAGVATVTSRIELGPCVLPLALENLWRVAEEFSVLDALAPGRVNVGISGGYPVHPELLGPLWGGADWDKGSTSVARALEFLDILRGDVVPAGDTVIVSPTDGAVPARLQPVRPGLDRRAWYAGVTRGSALEAARAGLAYTTAIMTRGRPSEGFFGAQQAIVDNYFGNFRGEGEPHLLLGRTLLPTDSADRPTAEKYSSRVDPRRAGYRAQPAGSIEEVETLPSPDYVGPSDRIVELLAADPIVSAAGELRVELPYGYSFDENRQILHDVAEYVAPQLGWTPANRAVGATAP